MTITPEVSKLQGFRIKTDRQLLNVVGKTLEHALIYTKLAEAHFNLGQRQLAQDRLAEAEWACKESDKLLRLVRYLRNDEKVLLERRLWELRGKLDELGGLRGDLRQMACCG